MHCAAKGCINLTSTFIPDFPGWIGLWIEMHKDFYHHLVVLALEKPLKSKVQLGIQECGLTCLDDLLNHNKGFLKVLVTNVFWGEKKKKVKSNNNHVEFSKDSARLCLKPLGHTLKALETPPSSQQPAIALFVCISYDSLAQRKLRKPREWKAFGTRFWTC